MTDEPAPSDDPRTGAESGSSQRASFLLGPVISFLNRLSYPRKFLLISGLFLAPLALVMTFLLQELEGRIEFPRKEIVGTQYLRPWVGLLLRSGDLSHQPPEDRKIAAIDQDFLAIETVDRDPGKDLALSGRLAALKEAWCLLKERLSDYRQDHITAGKWWTGPELNR